jgi:hypothetical protein
MVYLGMLGIGMRSNRLSIQGVGLGIAALLAAAASAGVIAFLTVRTLEWFRGGSLAVGMGGTYNLHGYELGLLSIYLPVAGMVYAAFQRRVRNTDLAFGALFFWLVFTIATTLLLPGASYMFLWPLVAGLSALGLDLWGMRSGRDLRGTLRLLPVAVGVLLVGTVIYLVQLMFGVGILAAGGFLTVLVLGLAFPYLDFHRLPRPAAWILVPAALGILIISGTFLSTRTTHEQPALNFIFYSMDADSGKAGWVAQSHLLDPTLFPLFGMDPHRGHQSDYFPTSQEEQVWIQAAPALRAAPPELRVVEDVSRGGERILRLNIRSQRGADGIMAEVTAENAVLSASLYGERHSRETPRSQVFFKVIHVPSGGVEIAVTVRAGVPVTVRLADVSRGMPLDDRQRVAFEQMPRSGYGGGHGIDSMTLIHRAYRLP